MARNDDPLTRYGALGLALIVLVAWPRAGAANGSAHFVRPLHTALQKTVAGRCLLGAVAGPGDRNGIVGLDLLIGELEVVVGAHTGLMIDSSDEALVDAAKQLAKMPRRIRREPVAVVMVLLDEWLGRTVNKRSLPSLLEQFRRCRPPKLRTKLHPWLETHFSILFLPACRAIYTISGDCGDMRDSR